MAMNEGTKVTVANLDDAEGTVKASRKEADGTILYMVEMADGVLIEGEEGFDVFAVGVEYGPPVY